jgi:prenyltransferase beta subunit
MKRIPMAVLTLLLLTVPPVWAADTKPSPIIYLTKLQQKDGGFVQDAGKDRSSLRATSSAIRAIKFFGGELPEASMVANFVKNCHDKASGGFADTPGGKPDVVTTAVGVMAVVSLKLPVEDYETGALKYLAENVKSFEDIRIAAAALEALGKKTPPKEAWLDEVVKLRNPDGTFGKGPTAARETGGATVAVLRMGGKVPDLETVLKTLNAGQGPSGGFARAGADADADLETSYRIVRAFHMLNTKPEGADRLRTFIAKCQNPDGGYGVMPGKPSSVSGTYFAGILLSWLK